MSLYGLSLLQLLLLLGASLGFLGVMYLLRRPPRVLPVSSTLLWQRVLERRKKRAPDYLRRLLSWLLVSAVALLAVLALADPEFEWLLPGRRQIQIVIANHASMLATDGRGVRRWDAAVEQVRELLQAESPSSRVVLDVTVAGDPDRRPLRPGEALERLGTLRVNFSKRSAFPPIRTGFDPVLFYSDGGSGLQIPDGVQGISLYAPLEDVSVESLTITPGIPAPTAVIEVANLGRRAGQVRVSLADSAGHSRVESVTLEGGRKASLRSRLEEFEPGPVVASLVGWRDSLELNDRRYQWLPPGRRRVLLAGDRSRPLETLLGLYTDLDVEYLGKPAELDLGGGDVLILSNWAPPEAPALPVLVMGTPEAPWLPRPAGQHEGVEGLRLDPEHPLTRGLDLPDLRVSRAGDVAPEGARILAASRSGSLILVQEEAQPRVQLTFRLEDSNLERHPGFAVLIENFLTWIRDREVMHVPLGEVEIPAGSRVWDPNGVELELREGLEHDRAELREPGIYSALTAQGRLQLVANPPPVGLPEAPPREMTSPGPVRSSAGPGWWRLLIGLALALGLGEWALYHRRLTV